MAKLTGFSYHYGDSFFHQIDVRFKLFFIIAISIVSLQAKSVALCILIFSLFCIMINISLPIKIMVKDIGWFLIFLCLIFLTRALSTPGIPVYTLKFIIITKQGLYDGAILCLRMLCIIMASLIFITTTMPLDIKAGIEWFLKPIPFIPEKKISTMISLLIRFIPLIFEQIQEIKDAQKSRGIENRKNPVYRLRKLIIPVMLRTFDKADKLVFAMESRCYCENRTGPELSCSNKDLILLISIILLCFIIIILNQYDYIFINIIKDASCWISGS